MNSGEVGIARPALGASRREAAVIGAGIVGVCCALSLQAEGFRVRLLDHADAGEGCSKGNAGHIAVEQIAPLSSPQTILQVPRMLLQANGPLTLRWSYLPKLLPWLVRFLLAGRPRRVAAATQALAALNRDALRAYDTLAEHIDLQGLVHKHGTLLVFESEHGRRQAYAQLNQLERFGVRCVPLLGAELQRFDPTLAGHLKGGLFFPDSAHVVNPHRLVTHLRNAFLQRGGTFQRAHIEDIHSNGSACRLVAREATFKAAIAVLAAGAWSGALASRLGHPVPLDTERGYHLMLFDPTIQPRVPTSSHEQRFVMTPMEHGLRLAGRVELAGLDAPQQRSRSTQLLELARSLLPALAAPRSATWMGFRPTLPDSLPIIDRGRHCRNVLFAFGHHHLGLTQAAITGALIADLAVGRRPSIDLQPFRVDRFGGFYRYRAHRELF
jgi:D-hydroxyproline dehydrogenase